MSTTFWKPTIHVRLAEQSAPVVPGNLFGDISPFETARQACAVHVADTSAQLTLTGDTERVCVACGQVMS